MTTTMARQENVMDTGSPEVVDYRPMKTAETVMTLGDGFVAVCPYPQELRESLH